MRRAHLAAARGRNDSGEQTPFMQTCVVVATSASIRLLHKRKKKNCFNSSILYLLLPAVLALCVADADVMLMMVMSVCAFWAVEDDNFNSSKEN